MIDVENHNNKKPLQRTLQGSGGRYSVDIRNEKFVLAPLHEICRNPKINMRLCYDEVVLCGLRALIIKSGGAAFSGK